MIRKLTLAVLAATLAFGGLVLMASPSSATYVWFDDDIVNSRTAQARFTGNWTLGSAQGGLVRWHYDNDSGVKRGEFKTSTYAQALPGTNPRCIAARVRWQTVTASPSFSVPAGASLTVGLSTTSNGWTVSCRGATSTTPPTPVFLNGVAFSSRLLLRVHADICHMATATSAWACATDSNAYGD